MREILFRGKRTDDGEGVYGLLGRVCADNTDIIGNIHDNPEVLKNGEKKDGE